MGTKWTNQEKERVSRVTSMVKDETYNGWTNRETWAVALHINNDQWWQERVYGALMSGEIKDRPTEYRYGNKALDEKDDAAYRAAQAGDIIRESVEEALEVDETGLSPAQALIIRDLGSLWRVDWTELGAAFLADVAESGE